MNGLNRLVNFIFRSNRSQGGNTQQNPNRRSSRLETSTKTPRPGIMRSNTHDSLSARSKIEPSNKFDDACSETSLEYDSDHDATPPPAQSGNVRVTNPSFDHPLAYPPPQEVTRTNSATASQPQNPQSTYQLTFRTEQSTSQPTIYSTGPSPLQTDQPSAPNDHIALKNAHFRDNIPNGHALQTKAFEHLRQSIQQGGLIQFVSPAAFHGEVSRDLSLPRFLTEMLHEQQTSNPFAALDIGDGIQISKIEKRDPYTNVSDEIPHSCYAITYEKNGVSRTVPVTLIGLSYAKNFFDAKELESVHAVYETHMTRATATTGSSTFNPAQNAGPSSNPFSESSQTQVPHITSFNGIGRSAALITIIEAKKRMQTHPVAAGPTDNFNVETCVTSVIEEAQRQGQNHFLQNKHNGVLQQRAEVIQYLRTLDLLANADVSGQAHQSENGLPKRCVLEQNGPTGSVEYNNNEQRTVYVSEALPAFDSLKRTDTQVGQLCGFHAVNNLFQQPELITPLDYLTHSKNEIDCRNRNDDKTGNNFALGQKLFEVFGGEKAHFNNDWDSDEMKDYTDQLNDIVINESGAKASLLFSDNQTSTLQHVELLNLASKKRQSGDPQQKHLIKSPAKDFVNLGLIQSASSTLSEDKKKGAVQAFLNNPEITLLTLQTVTVFPPIKPGEKQTESGHFCAYIKARQFENGQQKIVWFNADSMDHWNRELSIDDMTHAILYQEEIKNNGATIGKKQAQVLFAPDSNATSDLKKALHPTEESTLKKSAL